MSGFTYDDPDFESGSPLTMDDLNTTPPSSPRSPPPRSPPPPPRSPPPRSSKKPKRADYESTKDFFEAIQKYNKQQNESITQDIVITKTPDICGILYGEKDNEEDVLLQFTSGSGSSTECMYLSTLMSKYINNACRLYIEWIFDERIQANIKEKDRLPEEQGGGYRPVKKLTSIMQTFEQIKNDITNEFINLKSLYWFLPFFGGCYVDITFLLNIQYILKNNNKKEYVINLITRQHNIRLGNLYNSFGIGETHAQDIKYMIYDIDMDMDTIIYKSTYQITDMFNFKSIREQLLLQNTVIEKSDTLDFWGKSDGTASELMSVSETELCPATITRIENSLNLYNDEMIVNDIVDHLKKKILPITSLKLDQSLHNDLNKYIGKLKYLDGINMPLTERQQLFATNYSIKGDIIDIVELNEEYIFDSTSELNYNLHNIMSGNGFHKKMNRFKKSITSKRKTVKSKTSKKSKKSKKVQSKTKKAQSKKGKK